MPIATTFDQVRSAIVTAIRETLPTYEPRSSERWRPVEQKSDVPSTGLRSFFVELINIEEEGEVYGGCALHTADLLIWTSYTGLTGTEAQIFTARDQQDLWRSLHSAQVSGAPKFTKSPFEAENEAEGRYWGSHSFTAYLFLPLP